jgi:flagellar hook-associated protein 1 FlgK
MVISRAETLASRFNEKGLELNQIQKDIDSQVSHSVSEKNRLASLIADLNEKIAEVEIGEQNANDYRDMRGRALNELSSYIDIRYFEDPSGQWTVFAAGVANLVEKNSARTLAVSSNVSNDGYYDVLYETGSGTSMDITSEIRSGSLKAFVEIRDTFIPDVRDRLDLLAYTLVTEVNTLHQAGYGLDGSTGNLLFSSLGAAADASTNMAVAVSNTDRIAAASSILGLPGDNSMAISLADLQNQLTMNGGQSDFGEYYNSLVQFIGSSAQQTQNGYRAKEFSLQQLENMREAASGVSLDEEMANLIKYQRAFEASARLITLADEMLSNVIEMI